MKKLFLFYIIICFCFSLVILFLIIIIYLNKQFGIIGIKEKDFQNSNIKQKNSWKELNIYKPYYDIPRNQYNYSIISSLNQVYKKSVKEKWLKIMKKPLNLDNPKTFNEKMQWLKLYNSLPIKTLLTDKYLVRKYIKKKIGEEYLIPLLGVYDEFEDINFEQLPNKFVIKCNHGSGYNIIVKDKSKLNLTSVKTKLNQWMKTNFAFFNGMELHYRDIQAKIIIEKYMDDGTGDIKDYKITCFKGKPKILWVDSDRHTKHKRNLYDLNWNQLFYKINTNYETFPSPKKPKFLKKLLKFASILSKKFIYARIDFYIVNENIYFSEITFSSASGYEEIEPRSLDLLLGSFMKLPKLAYSIDIGEYYLLDNPLQTKLYVLSPFYMIEFSLIVFIINYIYKILNSKLIL